MENKHWWEDNQNSNSSYTNIGKYFLFVSTERSWIRCSTDIRIKVMLRKDAFPMKMLIDKTISWTDKQHHDTGFSPLMKAKMEAEADACIMQALESE